MGMIKSEREYSVSKQKVKEMETSLAESKKKLAVKDQHVLFGIDSFKRQIEDEIEEYENLKKGIIPNYMLKFENIGLLLIGLRIKNGLTQTDLAEKLNIAPSQVSRDENNDYHGVSTTTIKKILLALGEDISIRL